MIRVRYCTGEERLSKMPYLNTIIVAFPISPSIDHCHGRYVHRSDPNACRYVVVCRNNHTDLPAGSNSSLSTLSQYLLFISIGVQDVPLLVFRVLATDDVDVFPALSPHALAAIA